MVQREAERWHRPRAAPSVTRCPAHPRQCHLLTGRGTSKPGHFNIGAARETEGRLEDTGTLDGNRRSWLRRALKATSRWPPGPRARWPPRTQRRRGQRKQEEKKKKKEEKSCLLSRWCCEEGKEGHGQPGAVGAAAGHGGGCGREGGRGRLPSPRAGQRRFPSAGKAQPELGMRGQEQHHPLRCWPRGGPGPKAAVAAPAQRSCLVPAG